MSATETARAETTFDHDVVIVGGGPAGCAAGVFTARYGLDTVIFDRGRSSIQRCAHLENYLGFPAGIDIETLYGLLHDHAERAGCEIVSDLVESVERVDDGDGFVIGLQDGERVTARRVVAATRYDGEYMRGLDDETAMFETHEHDGEEHVHFDKSYAESDGTTPVDGLFIASPYGETGYQAIMAAGHGTRVGITVVEAVRREQGYPDPLANYYDWMRMDAELEDEWRDRDRWREQFDDRLPDDHGLGDERLTELREREIDRRLASYLSDEEIEQRRERGQKQLLEHIDDDLILRAAREIEST
ncbi:FAD-dependent oxidoreductase [Natrinema amylolyticum]|uniref:FAD-dependent oxidoreductase n=1 Tax=Natrinema amylolyticum TaxID=2878679 RepID=UPI001CFA9FBB|nr:FAD-dependent oxidoreductase [Natrinema amylolyticum]